MGDRKSDCEEVIDPSNFGRRDENVIMRILYNICQYSGYYIIEFRGKEFEIHLQNGIQPTTSKPEIDGSIKQENK